MSRISFTIACIASLAVIGLYRAGAQCDYPKTEDFVQTCMDYSFTTYVDSCSITSVSLDQTMNVSMTFSPILPAARVRITVKLIDSSQIGTFSIRITSAPGKENLVFGGLTPVIPNELMILSPLIDSTFRYPSTSTLSYHCDSIVFRNYGAIPFTIRTARLKRNMEFSMPPSQFPLMVQPGERRAIRVCFAPPKTEPMRDTLIVNDTCAVLTLPIAATAAPATGSTGCVTLSLSFPGENLSLLRISRPQPNPAHETLTIPVVSCGIGKTMSFSLLDMLGRVAATGYYRQETQSGNCEAGQCVADVSSLPTGTYIAVIGYGEHISTLRVIVR